MKKEIPFAFYKWIHSRIYKQAYQGRISKDNLALLFRQFHNIPKSIYPIYLKELEILGLIKEEDGFIKVTTPKLEEEELIIYLKKELKMGLFN